MHTAHECKRDVIKSQSPSYGFIAQLVRALYRYGRGHRFISPLKAEYFFCVFSLLLEKDLHYKPNTYPPEHCAEVVEGQEMPQCYNSKNLKNYKDKR